MPPRRGIEGQMDSGKQTLSGGCRGWGEAQGGVIPGHSVPRGVGLRGAAQRASSEKRGSGLIGIC